MANKNTQIRPPRAAERLVGWLIRHDLEEEVLGDLEEKFYRELERKSLLRSQLNYWYQVMNYLRPFAIKRSTHSNYKTMFKYYFRLSWRNLIKQKIYAAIKIGGFALGIAATLLIALFIRDELSYDQHYEDQDQLYRVLNESTHPEHLEKWSAFPPPIKSALENEFPEIEQVGRLINFDWFDAGANQFRPISDETNVYEEGFVYVDPEMIHILEIPMIYGNQTALDNPSSIVISESKAAKYFPNQDPVGQQIILNESNESIYTIGGVMEDSDAKSFFHFDFLITLEGKEFWPGEQTSWGSWNYSVFVKLKEGSDYKQLQEKLLVIRDDYIIPYNREQGDVRADDLAKYHQFHVQPVGQIHLYGENTHDNIEHGDIGIIWLFGAIAFFILILACINFINLSTAKSANRAKEVGIQKVLGSFRSEIIWQYLTEAFLYALIALVVGLMIAIFSLPFFNSLAGKSLSMPWNQWWLVPGFVGFLVVVGLLSGLYPSFYLSAFKPIQVIRGSLSRGAKDSKLRGALVVFQFATSIVLIICTIVTYRQMDFILNKKVGYEKDQILLLQGVSTLGSKSESFRAELSNLASIHSATYTNFLPVAGTKRDGNSFWREGKRKEEEGIIAQKWRVDPNYLGTMGMTLIEGRNFSENMASDSAAIIINERMVKEMGFENPIGQRITNGFESIYHVIGVIEDFHFESFKREVSPLTLAYGTSGDIMVVKIATDNTTQALGQVNQVWDEFMPNQSIRYTFLDDSYARMYDQVNRTGRVFTLFAILAIVVACLGLFALSAFMVEQRSKEISIRKVLGASMSQIFGLLTSNFVKLVLISIFIAAPAGWYLMREWLSDYVYHIEITWDIYLISGLIALVISLITISSESLRAGLMNPAQKLRSE